MRKTITIAKMHRNGRLVRVKPDGAEEALDIPPLPRLSAAEIEAAAARDHDNLPLSDARPGQLRPVPRVKTLRRALALTQEEFAARYHIPLGTLPDWEQGRSEPDQPARAYLTVIARDPEGVERALQLAVKWSSMPRARGDTRQRGTHWCCASASGRARKFAASAVNSA
jgi:putative transcriptional regulator